MRSRTPSGAGLALVAGGAAAAAAGGACSGGSAARAGDAISRRAKRTRFMAPECHAIRRATPARGRI